MPGSRRACDRCHSQKLRCPRISQDNNDSCSRCRNAGALCVYSAPLPTGRPTSNQSISGKNAVPTNHSSVGSGSHDDTVTPTLADMPHLSQPSIDIDPNFPWDQYELDSDNMFDPSLLADVPLGTGPELRDTSLSSTTIPTNNPTTHHPSNLDPYGSRLPNTWPTNDTDTTEICIQKLSDLSVRLYPVYRTSCRLAAAQKESPGTLSADAAFEAVTAFVQGDTTIETAAVRGCKALHEIFGASRSLLDILDQSFTITTASSPRNPASFSALTAIDADDPMSISSSDVSSLSNGFPFSSQPSDSRASTNSVPMPGSTLASTTPDRASSFPVAGEDGPDGAMVHLILACYIRLLHIYHTLIATLHHDSLHRRDIGSGSPSFFELRLVVFVQFITHLLDRLRNAVAAYLSPLNNPSNTITAASKAMDVSRLEDSMRDELQKLHQRLQR